MVDVDDAGQRADVVLGRRVPGLSRRVARRLALAGALQIDGERAAPSARVGAGQRLVLALPPTDDGGTRATILAQTERFVYAAKPAGVHTVALTPGQADCLAVWIARQHPECAAASPDPREAGAVHRLDRDTSGVVAFARSPEAWERGRAAFEAGEVGKRYLAVCRADAVPGWPPVAPEDALPGWLEAAPGLPDPVPLPAEGLVPLDAPDGPSAVAAAYRIRAPIGRGSARGSMAVRLDGQGATTLLHARGHAPWGLVCELELLTGRRHQARVHLAWAGLPIVGDTRYGPRAPPPPPEPPARLHLHAARLDLSAAFADEPPVTAPVDARLFAL